MWMRYEWKNKKKELWTKKEKRWEKIRELGDQSGNPTSD